MNNLQYIEAKIRVLEHELKLAKKKHTRNTMEDQGIVLPEFSGKALRDLRKRAGITTVAASVFLNVSRSTLSNIEKEVSAPLYDNVRKLTNFYNESIFEKE